jgi:hypothetical protein
MSDHCQIMRDEFELLDRRNSEQLGNFFVRYKFFSTNDLAQVLSLSSRYIRRLKSRTDICRTRGRKTSPQTIKTPLDMELEPGWDCEEWWRRQYQLHGVYILSRISHFSVKTVRRRLSKYNIKTGVRSTNSCRNYEWLHKHYVELDQNVVTCAKLAGVSPDTITTWLNNFKIQVKTRNAPKVQARNSTTVGEAPCITIRTD